MVDGGSIVEAMVERDDDGPVVGSILPARLHQVLQPGRRAIAILDGGVEALLEPVPARITEGMAFVAEVVREALPEAGALKRARVRMAPDDAALGPGPDLFARLSSSPHPVQPTRHHDSDLLEAAGWGEVLDAARTGDLDFDGGRLRISPTPAMTLIDVDGDGDLAALAIAGAAASAAAIRRLGIGGSIGIDLPTAGRKDARLAAAEAIDRLLPQPFERTAVNGFGFVQIVRPRARASLIERVREDPAVSAALALLRRAERTPGAGPLHLTATPGVLGRIRERGWSGLLARRVGAEVVLHPDPGRPIWVGDVHRQPL
nr:ribonuclease [Sphingomonas jejuensis]